MVGRASVKRSVEQLIATAKANYDKEKRGERIDLLTLNRLFIGNPGTGKTTVAAIYGKILKALRYLSNGDVMLRVGSDLTGDHVGEAQTRTRAILEMAQGKVLLIDEAYVLDDDLYGKQALNTIVEKVQATAGADMAVILAGYEQPMLKMLRDQNPGLSSRFDPKFALRFEDYDDEDLLKLVAGSVAKGSVCQAACRGAAGQAASSAHFWKFVSRGNAGGPRQDSSSSPTVRRQGFDETFCCARRKSRLGGPGP